MSIPRRKMNRMSNDSYNIICDESSVDLLPSYGFGIKDFTIKRLSVDTLRSLAHFINRLAVALEETKSDDQLNESPEKEENFNKHFEKFDNEDNFLECKRNRSGSVDSGFGDEENNRSDDDDDADDSDDGLKIITLDEVSYHCTKNDGWIVLYDKVYDISEYLENSLHPAGEDLIIEYLGYDATMAFRSVGHSKGAFKTLEKYIIGVLPSQERLGLSNEWT